MKLELTPCELFRLFIGKRYGKQIEILLSLELKRVNLRIAKKYLCDSIYSKLYLECMFDYVPSNREKLSCACYEAKQRFAPFSRIGGKLTRASICSEWYKFIVHIEPCMEWEDIIIIDEEVIKRIVRL